MAVDLPSLYLLDARMGWTLSSSEGVIPLGDSTLGLARPDTAPATGRCVLGPLDGRVANCVWDEIALEFAALPPGGKLAVRTFATDGSDRPFTPPLETADGGENGGPGAVLHTLRSLHLILPICRDIERLCPDALMLNFTNPEARVLHAILTLTAVRAAGICHGVFSALDAISRYTQKLAEQKK